MIDIFKKYKTDQGGFVLLYAVLAVTVILVVGLIITNIITKQIILSTTGRDSQFAYYAADSMRECVFYWHLEKGAFGYLEDNSLVREDYSGLPIPYNISCFGNDDVSVTREDEDGYEGPSGPDNFQVGPVNITSGSKTTCVQAFILRYPNASAGEQTEIRASGYNVACDFREGSLRSVERTVVSRF